MTAPQRTTTLASKIAREARNFVRLQRDLAERRILWQSRPLHLEYSFSTACNLRCAMCHQSLSPPIVTSQPGRGEALLEEFGVHGTIWNPSATSEPLVNDGARILEICRRQGLFLEIITNAMLLSVEVFEALVPHLNRLKISIDSHVPAVVERVRKGVRFDVLHANARHAFSRCTELGIPCAINCVLLRDNLDHLEAFVDWCAELGAREIALLQLLENSPDYSEFNAWERGSDAVHRALDDMLARASERGVNLFIQAPPPHGGRHVHSASISRVHSASALEMLHEASARESLGFCPQLASYLKVNPDGRAYPCCRAPEELYLGNAFAPGGLEAVWNGAAMQALRQRHLAGDLPTPCRGCAIVAAPRWDAERESGD